MKKMLFLTLIILLVYNVNCFAISTMENEFDLYSGQHQSTCIDYKFPYIKELGVVHIQVENNGFQSFEFTIKDGDKQIKKNIVKPSDKIEFDVNITPSMCGEFSVSAHSCQNIGDTIVIYLNAIQKISAFSTNARPVQDISFPLNYSSSWAVLSINRAVSLGYINERMQKEYTDPISRKDFGIILYKVLNQNDKLEPIEKPLVFKDIFINEINTLASVGIIKGRNDDIFGAEDSITREEAATILARTVDYLQIPLLTNTYSKYDDDNNISTWAKDGVYSMQQCNIMLGTDNNNFEPQANYTKEQAIATIMRLYNVLNKQ